MLLVGSILLRQLSGRQPTVYLQTRAYTRLLLIVKPPLPEFTHNYRLSIIVTIWKQSY